MKRAGGRLPAAGSRAETLGSFGTLAGSGLGFGATPRAAALCRGPGRPLRLVWWSGWLLFGGVSFHAWRVGARLRALARVRGLVNRHISGHGGLRFKFAVWESCVICMKNNP